MPDEKKEIDDSIEELRMFINRGREVRMYTNIQTGEVRFEGFHVFNQTLTHKITGAKIEQRMPMDFCIPITEDDLSDSMYETLRNVFDMFEHAKMKCRDRMIEEVGRDTAEPDIIPMPATILDATGRIAEANLPVGLEGM